ncbi:MAG: septum formation initiator family protein [Chitinophagaceae bacterium]|nr:septum formation initiator family protein [Chitinophagaceae bacterium]
MQKITKILTNKYLLTAVFFLVWMLFVDQRDFFQQRERKAELQKLEAKKRYYQEEINKARKTLTDLQSNPAALEKFARERYLMKKDGEDIFTLEDSTAITK